MSKFSITAGVVISFVWAPEAPVPFHITPLLWLFRWEGAVVYFTCVILVFSNCHYVSNWMFNAIQWSNIPWDIGSRHFPGEISERWSSKTGGGVKLFQTFFKLFSSFFQTFFRWDFGKVKQYDWRGCRALLKGILSFRCLNCSVCEDFFWFRRLSYFLIIVTLSNTIVIRQYLFQTLQTKWKNLAVDWDGGLPSII